jgi:hypothetical protein
VVTAHIWFFWALVVILAVLAGVAVLSLASDGDDDLSLDRS